MSSLKTYVSSLPGMTDKELGTEARSAAALLSRARKSGTKRAVANLEKMRQAIEAEKVSRKEAVGNPLPASRRMERPIRLAYRKTEPYDAILYNYEDGTWWFEIRDPGYGGELVYDDHDGRSRSGAEREALRVIKKGPELNPSPDAKPKKVATLAAFKKLPVGTLITAQGYTGNIVSGPRGLVGLYAAPSKLYESSKSSELGPLSYGARYFFTKDLEDFFSKGTWATKGNPKKKKPKKKKAMSTAGRAAVGAGVGALALGPIGAIGLGYAATKYKPTEAKGNPAVKKEEKYRDYRVVFLAKDGMWDFKIYKGTRKVHENKGFPFILGAAAEAKAWIDSKSSRKNPGDKFKVHVTGVYYSAETGEQPMRETVMVEAQTKDEARKKAASKVSERATGMGYEFDGKHRGFKAEKMGRNPKKRPKETLIAKSRRLWDAHVAKPTRKSLKPVLRHLEDMEKSSAKTVKAEWRRAKKAAHAEAKRLKMKV